MPLYKSFASPPAIGNTTPNTGAFTTISASTDGSQATPAITRSSDTDTGIFFPSANQIAFTEGGAEAMRIDSSGRVGIGTTSPRQRLHQIGTFCIGGEGNNVNKQFLQVCTPYAIANKDWSVLGGFDNSTDRVIYLGGGGWSRPDATSIRFFTASAYDQTDNAGVERLRIDSNGNVGIGSAGSASIKLTVDSGSAAQYAAFNSTNANGGFLTLSSSGTVHGDIGTAAQLVAGGSASDFAINARGSRNMVLGTNNIERMRITSGGDVCVGATSSAAGRFTVERSDVNTVASLFSRATGDVGQRAFLVSKYDNNTTTSQVFVTFAVNNANSNSGQINANGANQAAFGSTSDERLKQNIQNITSQWDNFKSLRPVEFDYIESEGGNHQIGFIAQEVIEIFPDAVGERQDGMLTLSGLGKNEARLIKALQEAMERIETLESSNATLESRIAALEAA